VPAWSEVLLTAGLISLLILLYRAFVWVFPVLPAEEEASHA
jgi:Ni/Fe-hydrogenase subunit HybB-like protein